METSQPIVSRRKARPRSPPNITSDQDRILHPCYICTKATSLVIKNLYSSIRICAVCLHTHGIGKEIRAYENNKVTPQATLDVDD